MSQTKQLNYSDPQRNCFLVDHPTRVTEEFSSLPNTIPTFGATDWGDKGVSNQKNLRRIFRTNSLTNRDVAIKFIQPLTPVSFDNASNYNPDFYSVDYTFKNTSTSGPTNDNPQLGAAPNIAYPSEPTSISDPNTVSEPVTLEKGAGNSWGSREKGIENRGAFQTALVLNKYLQ